MWPLVLEHAPADLVALRSDQREHVGLAAVLADERRGQPEPAARLQLRGQPEHRRGDQVHLVVDDEAPRLGREPIEVRDSRSAPAPPRLLIIEYVAIVIGPIAPAFAPS